MDIRKYRDSNLQEIQEVIKEYKRINNQVRKDTRRAIKIKAQGIARNAKSNPKLFGNIYLKR